MTTVDANGVTLGVEHFGDPRAPLVLLTGGTTMLSWPDALCAALARGGRYVVRYDLRDSGASTTVDPRAPAYTLRARSTTTCRPLRGDDGPAVLALEARLIRSRCRGGVRHRWRGDPRRRPRRGARDRRAHLGPHAKHGARAADGQPAGPGVRQARLQAALRERLPELAIPALVVHGRRDPFFPVGNGEALARETPVRGSSSSNGPRR